MRKSAFTVSREAVDLAAVAEDVRAATKYARDAGLTLLLCAEAGGVRSRPRHARCRSCPT